MRTSRLDGPVRQRSDSEQTGVAHGAKGPAGGAAGLADGAEREPAVAHEDKWGWRHCRRAMPTGQWIT
ncbi:hypothetical protein GCM10010442_33870 [Kitasatospora kifunensis]